MPNPLLERAIDICKQKKVRFTPSVNLNNIQLAFRETSKINDKPCTSKQLPHQPLFHCPHA